MGVRQQGVRQHTPNDPERAKRSEVPPTPLSERSDAVPRSANGPPPSEATAVEWTFRSKAEARDAPMAEKLQAP